MQFNADALRRWYSEFYKDAKQAYWSLHKASGQQKGPKLALHEDSDIEGSWSYLYDTISNQIDNGVREFVVLIRRAKTDPNYLSYFLTIPYQPVNQYNPGGPVAGIGNPYQGGPYPAVYGPGPADIGEIKRELTEKFQKDLDHERQKWQYERQLEKMEEMIEGIQHDRRNFVEQLVDGIERILGVIDNPNVAGLLVNLMNKTGGAPAMAPNIAGNTGGAPAARKKPGVKIAEQPASQPEPGPLDDDDDEPLKGTEIETDDYELAAEAVDIMLDAGIENPGAKFLKLARFAAQNPQMVESFMQNIPG